MKKIIICFAVALSIVMSSSAVFAGSGKAFIPSWRVFRDASSSTHYETKIWLSNISDSTISLTITLYSQDNSSGYPTVFSDDTELHCVNYSGTYNENPTTGSVTFDIAPYETCYFQAYSGNDQSDTYGHGFIEWTAADDENQPALGLVAHGYTKYINLGNTRSYAYDITINGGNPF